MSTETLPLERQKHIREFLLRALEEDIGAGDATTLALVDSESMACAEIVAREDMILSGVRLAAAVFHLADPDVQFEYLYKDGDFVARHRSVLKLSGPARAILTAERTAVNLLQHLSGIATATARVVAAVAEYETQVLDTRKTTPTMRALEKYAVACGGGTNHRFGLFDAILIKDNHLAFWRQAHHKHSLAAAVKTAREAYPDLKIEIEVDTLEQLKDALAGDPDWVLLDNMPPSMVADAVRMCEGKCKTEASGGITLQNVVDYARTGVTAISLGALTHSARAMDLSLDFK